ncbi:glycoside hydrolase family 3 protein [Streptomyces albipurpureus]|uniref:beta-N-acetylhexosaminidase n=1 Tax=Streptomyces albipurpureus TaxID=2897419 RepID=A0ABT0UU64_9ACTN|nr:glycoside hydrolase family 3 protein [Streptomyces sp. CWNU-1]MCM2392127.1 glycoside hydrolase family 3 protein [Streptomyces sp. CWNU-1]
MQDRSLSRRTLIASAAVGAATVGAVTGMTMPAAAAEGRATQTKRLNQLIARMSLEEKVGQLFVPYFYGSSATAPAQNHVDSNLREIGVRNVAEMIQKYHLGGLIYFGWSGNITNPHQLVDLSNDIQKIAKDNGTLPIVISIDQEHGPNTRVGPPATQLPGPMALGANGSVSDARTAAEIAGVELAAMGIHQNFAPVADVNVNPANPIINIRSFGSDARHVSRLTAAQVRGYERKGIATSAKHFPGHGDTGTDSHTELPVITHTREEWERIDAPPFRAAIDAGVSSIMTAHLQVPALDPSNDPATLSRPIITGVLRGELGYDGVIVTDALNMRGVRTKYGDDRVPVLALKAGVDQLLFVPNLDLAWNSVLNAVRSGELTEARLDESILRILRMKDKVGLLDGNPYVTHRGVDRTVGIRKHLDTAERIAERTVTLLVNKGDFLPLSRRKQRKVLVTGQNPGFPYNASRTSVALLSEQLTAQGFTPSTVTIDHRNQTWDDANIARAVAGAAGQDVVVVLTSNVGATSRQRVLVQQLVATGVPVVTVAIGNPYDIAHLSGVKASLATYGGADAELPTLARVLAGRGEPGGRLPAAIPRADNPAQALYPVGYGLSYDD